MAFIPADKMKILREAAAKGDENAKKIINAHFSRKDYSHDLDAYFAPKPEQEVVKEEITTKVPESKASEVSASGLNKWLSDNNISATDPDFNDAVEEYYAEFPNERPKEEQKSLPVPDANVKTNAMMPNINTNVAEEEEMAKDIANELMSMIAKNDEMWRCIVQNDDIEDTTKKGAMTILSEVKQSLYECVEKIKKVKNSLTKKETEEKTL